MIHIKNVVHQLGWRTIYWYWKLWNLKLERLIKTDLPILFGMKIKHHAYCISDCGFEVDTGYDLKATQKKCKTQANANPDCCSMIRIIYHDRPGYEYIVSDQLAKDTGRS